MSSVTGVVSSTTGTVGWTNPNNIFTSNSAYAVSASISSLSTTGSIYALGSGFSIPSSATIDGVAVIARGKNALSGNGFRIRPTLNDIFLRSAGADLSPNSPAGITTVTWTGTTDTTNTLGGATSLWSSTITPSIVNDASFGVRIRFQNLNGTAQAFSLDYVAITVYYTVAGVTSSQQMFMQII